MSEYIRKLTDDFLEKAPSIMKTQVTYPVNDESDTAGFRVDKETAIKLATQLLIAAQTSESIFITGERSKNTIRVAKYK